MARIGRWAAVVVAAGAASATALAADGAAGASTQGTKVTIVTTSKGKVLSAGKTVYTLKASSTPCTSLCLKIWPAVVLSGGAKHATAGSGVTTSKLGSVRVPGVGVQVTYGGKRLYRFSGDAASGSGEREYHRHLGQVDCRRRGQVADIRGGNVIGIDFELGILERWKRWDVLLGATPPPSN